MASVALPRESDRDAAARALSRVGKESLARLAASRGSLWPTAQGYAVPGETAPAARPPAPATFAPARYARRPGRDGLPVTAARAGSPEPDLTAGLAAAAPRASRQGPPAAPPQPVGGHRASGLAHCPGRRRTPIRRRQGRAPPARPSASFGLCELLYQTFSCLPSVAAQCRQREPSPPASIVPRSNQSRNPTSPVARRSAFAHSPLPSATARYHLVRRLGTEKHSRCHPNEQPPG